MMRKMRRFYLRLLIVLLILPLTIMATDKGQFDEQNIVLRFGAISDTHLTGGAAKLEEALKLLFEKVGENKLDVLLIAGDLTDSGSATEITAFKKSLDKVEFDKKGTKLIFALGNHDTDFDKLPYNGLAFKKGLGAYAYEGALEDEIKNGNHHIIVNGYHFIAVNTKKYNGGCEHAPEDLAWLKNALDEAVKDDPHKPIFVATHPLVYDTVYGSLEGSYWASSNLGEVLKDYHQVISFGGHLHSPLNDERTIFQRDFTSLNTAAVKYVSLDSVIEGIPPIDLDGGSTPRNCNFFSQGLYLEVDRNHNVRITRMDFFRAAEIKSPWLVPAPKADKSHLKYYTTEARKSTNQAPYFEDDAYVNIRRVAKKKLDIEFSAAKDDDLVYAYEIRLLDKATLLPVGATYAITYSDFYMTPDPSKMVTKVFKAFSTDAFKLTEKEFDLSKEYLIKIVAMDSFGLKSEPLYSESN